MVKAKKDTTRGGRRGERKKGGRNSAKEKWSGNGLRTGSGVQNPEIKRMDARGIVEEK